MAHEYAKDAKASHDKKLASYGGKSKTVSSTADAPDKDGDATNFAGEKALNTNKQAGRAPLNSNKYEAPEVRVQRKKGGKIVGASSLKRLDRAPRGKSPMKGTGQRIGPVPSGTSQQEAFDPTTRFKAGEMNEMSPRKKGGRIQDYEARSHESTGAHDDEREDRKLVKKMVKGEALTGKCGGGRMKRGEGGIAPEEEIFESEDRLRKNRGKINPETGTGVSAEDRRSLGKALRNNITPGEYRKGNLGEGEFALKKGGVAKRANRDMGGVLSSAGKSMGIGGDADGDEGGKKLPTKAKGTTVNILIGDPKNAMGGAAGMAPPPMIGGPPPAPPMAPPPGGPPPGAGGPPPGGPPMMPPGGPGGMPPGGMPMMRKDGGKVQVPYKRPGKKDGYPAMDFGSGGGFGRKQKMDSYGTKMGGGKS